MTLNHEQPDKVVVDLGSCLASGIAASALNRLRNALGLKKELVKIHEPFQMLGEIEEDVRQALGVDVVGISTDSTMFGFENKDWKPWKLFDGTDVLVAGGFDPVPDEKGNLYLYPGGDKSAKPCAMMPKGGFYFDMLVRQQPLDENTMDAREDYKDDDHLFTDEELKLLQDKADFYYNNTEYGIIGGNFLCGLGDFAILPGPTIKEPKGIRNLEEWLVAHYIYPDYIKDRYAMQTETALENLCMYKEAVGDKIQAIQISGTDFGTQKGEFISPDMYREFYMPYFKKLNDWVHSNTTWKTMYHTCGSIINFMDDFAETGMDILNPVQCSAAGMDAKTLKEKYGKKFVFWGGGIDTQKTLPFGSVQDVEREVTERLDIFSKDGGFVFNAVHNIQSNSPTENMVAMFRTVQEYNGADKAPGREVE